MAKEYEQEFGEAPPSDVWGTLGTATESSGSYTSGPDEPPPPPPPCPPPIPTCANGYCPACATETACNQEMLCHWTGRSCDSGSPPPPCPTPPPPPRPGMPPTIRLHNGLSVPAVACGTGGDNNASAQVTVRAALTAGFRHIDTAHDYGDQAGVGEALAAWQSEHPLPSEQPWLTTKVPGCGVPTQGLMPPCYNNTLRVAEEDLSLLGLQSVDLMLIHFPPLLGCIPANCKHMQQQWAALETLYTAKRAKAIGVSNYCKTCLECIMETATILPMVNQIQYHVGMGSPAEYGDGLLEWCDQHEIAVFAYSPLGGGRLLAAESPFIDLAERIAPKYKWGLGAHPTQNVTAAQVALAWIGQKNPESAHGGQQVGFVTKSSNPTYLAEDLGIWAWSDGVTFPAVLSAADRYALDHLTATSLQCKEEAPGGCCK